MYSYQLTPETRVDLRQQLKCLLNEIACMQVDVIDGAAQANEALIPEMQHAAMMLGYRLAMAQIATGSEIKGCL